MSVKQEDVKPDLDAFNIPVEEEEQLEFGPNVGNTKIWAMKIPGFLYERWERVKASGVHLGTLVVDNSTSKPTITLKLPKEPEGQSSSEPPKKRRRDELDTRNIPDEYHVDMLERTVVKPTDKTKEKDEDHRWNNKFIFSEHKRTWVAGPGEGQSNAAKRKKEKARPCFIGPVDHEVNVRPINTPQYRKLLADRRLESEQSKKPIVVITSDMMSQGKLNQMASGFSNASSTLGKGMISGSGKVPGERHARLDKNELTDRLFQLFSERPYWSIAALKARLQQPDMWLREVLKDVAEVITGGHYANMWQLKEDWKGNGEGEAKAEADGDDDDDDEDEDESDLEEVQLIE